MIDVLASKCHVIGRGCRIPSRPHVGFKMKLPLSSPASLPSAAAYVAIIPRSCLVPTGTRSSTYPSALGASITPTRLAHRPQATCNLLARVLRNVPRHTGRCAAKHLPKLARRAPKRDPFRARALYPSSPSRRVGINLWGGRDHIAAFCPGLAKYASSPLFGRSSTRSAERNPFNSLLASLWAETFGGRTRRSIRQRDENCASDSNMQAPSSTIRACATYPASIGRGDSNTMRCALQMAIDTLTCINVVAIWQYDKCNDHP